MISTKGRYAIRVLLDLAEQGGDRFIPLKDIAERQGISKKYLEIRCQRQRRLLYTEPQAGRIQHRRSARIDGGYALTGYLPCQRQFQLSQKRFL